MARERALVVSRVRIEKYDKDMKLVDIHESKVPNMNSADLNPRKDEKDEKESKK